MEETINKVKIPIFCPQEREQVGTIEAVPSPRDGRVLLDAALAWRSFIPTEEKYKLKAQPKDGDFLFCPHCLGHLSLRGEVTITAPRKIDGKTERAKMPEQTVPIVLAATAIEG